MRGLFALFFLPSLAFSFAIQPWYSPIGEFQWRSKYAYSHSSSICQNGGSLPYRSHDHQVGFGLGVQFWPGWEAQLQGDFTNTTKLSWGLKRIGLQLRHLVLDDVKGDSVSLSLGLQSYYVPTRCLRDVSTPYHAQGNLELGVAVGKEIDQTYYWLYRFWGFLGVGIANRGALWVRPLCVAEVKLRQRHEFKLFSEGYFGLGNRSIVFVEPFNGYAQIAHRSIEVGLGYTYLFRIWGALGLQYTRRIYAHNFPQQAHTFTLSYRLPFSIF